MSRFGDTHFSPARVWAMLLRYLYILRSSWPRTLELLYWPTLQMLIWGFMSQFLYQNSSYVARAFGVLLAAVILARLVWRWIPGHQVSSAEAGWMRLASKGTHYLLYALLLAEAALGFTFRWGAGRQMEFFGLGIPPMIGEIARPLRRELREFHEWIGWAIVILALLHAFAALYHHYVLKDRVLKRMLPGQRTA